MVYRTLKLIDILRMTLAEVELSSDPTKDAPALGAVKDSLLRAITELSVHRDTGTRDPLTIDAPQPLPADSAIEQLD
jgi:hypothetical protein